MVHYLKIAPGPQGRRVLINLLISSFENLPCHTFEHITTVMFSIPATLAIHLNLVRKGITGAVGCDRSNWKSWTHWLETIWAL